MNHLRWNDLLELLDGRVAPDRRSELEGHLAACERCRRFAESQKSLERIARSVPGAEPSRDFTGRVLKVLRSSRRQERSLRLLALLGAGIPLALVGGLAAFAVAAGGGSEEDLFGGAFGELSTVLGKIHPYLASAFGSTGDSIARAAQTDVLAIAALTAASVLLLLLADRLVLHRLRRPGP